MKRKTDEEFNNDKTGLNENDNFYKTEKDISLKEVLKQRIRCTGVYILYLNGRVMKCGRVAHKQGLHWRFQQYYFLNYDNNARRRIYNSVTLENRDNITVSWQTCPPSKCVELESKLFIKYGKGEWAKRSPKKIDNDTCKLLI